MIVYFSMQTRCRRRKEVVFKRNIYIQEESYSGRKCLLILKWAIVIILICNPLKEIITEFVENNLVVEPDGTLCYRKYDDKKDPDSVLL